MKIVLSSVDARTPLRGSKYAAGYDMFSSEYTIIPPWSRVLINTGVSMELPKGSYGRILPRSGLACKKNIDTGAGVIDSDYRGDVKVLLINNSSESYEVNIGDKIAQLVIQPYIIVEMELAESLDETERGDGGFGSTGK